MVNIILEILTLYHIFFLATTLSNRIFPIQNNLTLFYTFISTISFSVDCIRLVFELSLDMLSDN